MRKSKTSSLVTDIGSELRRLRRNKGLTLDSVAKASGFTKMYISKVERGQISFPLMTLYRIARVLKVDVVEILKGADEVGHRTVRQVPAERCFKGLGEQGVRTALLCHQPQQHVMVPLFFEIETGREMSGLSEGPDDNGQCEVWVYVLRGRLGLMLNGNQYEGDQGSTFYFRANQPHAYKNMGNGKAEFLAVRVPQT